MNAVEFRQGQFPLWKEVLIMSEFLFPPSLLFRSPYMHTQLTKTPLTVMLSLLIITFSLTLALSENTLNILGTTLQLIWAVILHKLGLFEAWKRKGRGVQNLIRRHQEELEALYGEGTKEKTVESSDSSAV